MKTGLLSTTVIAGLAGLALPTAAAAQVATPVEATNPETPSDLSQPQQDANEGEIVVTGTRIARPDLETASPVSVVQSEEIELRQANDAEQLLRDLPQVRPNLGPGVNNGSTGAANIDLRGIGSQRTLTLLDGRRIVPFDLGGVPDLNVIPVALVERVDVVTGGASSVYGADAVAGVVNFITKRNFRGIDVSGNYRITEQGDAAQYRGDILLGADLAEGRGNVVIGLGYFNRSPLNQNLRSFGVSAISSVNGLPQGSSTTAPVTLLAPGIPGVSDPSFGAFYDVALGRFRTATQADTYNFNPDNLYQTPLERYSTYASGYFEISPAAEVYANALFARNLAAVRSAPSATFNNTFFLPLNNPFINAATRNQLCAAGGVTQADCDIAGAVVGGPGTPGYREVAAQPSRRFIEYGPRFNKIDTDTFQVVTGVRGKIIENLRYDLFAQYGESSQTFIRDNWGSASRVQQALRAFQPATGGPVCSVTTNGCVPLNLFGPVGSITPDQLNFIDLDAIIARNVTQTVVNGSISGDVGNITSPLAENPIGFAIGAEYRRLTAENRPDPASQIQGEVLGTGARTPADFGEYDVRELFGEVAIPLIENGFIHNATVEAGIRFSDYSTTGKSRTWKVGGVIEPIEGFRGRIMYQKAVRSPNIAELFSSPVQGLNNLTNDPCAGLTPSAPRVLCEATGAPAASYGSIPTPNSNQINTTTSGNPRLDVERAETWTIGAVIAPRRLIPNLALTIDWFKIKIDDLISAPAQADILNGCYSPTLNPSQTPNAFCSLISRNPFNGSLNGAGETPGVILASSNLGKLSTSGIDFGATYKVPLGNIGFGGDRASLDFGVNGTYLRYYRVQSNPISVNRACEGFYSTACTNPRPKWKWNARAGVDFGAAGLSLLWNHISAVEFEPIRPAGIPITQPAPGNSAVGFNGILPRYREVDSYDLFDLSARVEATRNFTFTFLVENLLDKKPPILGTGVGGTAFNNGNTFPTTYDVFGRTYTVGARMRF